MKEEVLAFGDLISDISSAALKFLLKRQRCSYMSYKLKVCKGTRYVKADLLILFTVHKNPVSLRQCKDYLYSQEHEEQTHSSRGALRGAFTHPLGTTLLPFNEGRC